MSNEHTENQPSQNDSSTKSRYIKIGVCLMFFSVLLGFAIGFIVAFNNTAFGNGDFDFLLVFLPLEGIGFFVGFVMLIVGLVLPDQDIQGGNSRTVPPTPDELYSIERDKEMQEMIRQEVLRIDELERIRKEQEIERKRIQEEEEAERLRKIKEENERQADRQRRKELSMPLFREAVEHFTARNFRKALRCCDKSLASFPHANTFLLRAWINEATEKNEQVVKDCTNSLQLDTDLLEARFIRGRAFVRLMENAQFYFNRKWWFKAVDDLSAIPESYEHHAEARKMLSKLYSKDFQNDCRLKSCLTFTFLMCGTVFVFLLVYVLLKQIFSV